MAAKKKRATKKRPAKKRPARKRATKKAAKKRPARKRATKKAAKKRTAKNPATNRYRAKYRVPGSRKRPALEFNSQSDAKAVRYATSALAKSKAGCANGECVDLRRIKKN